MDNGRVNFDTPLNLPKPSSMNEGWSIGGEYWTSTDEEGAHTLNMDGYLESPDELDPQKPHYVGFVIDNDYKVSNEMFWTGYEPPSTSSLGSKASFFRHIPRATGYDLIAERAANRKNPSIPVKPCDLVSLEYESETEFEQTQENPCPLTWTPTKKPSIEGKRLNWGGKRSYKMEVPRFTDYKLGKSTDYYLKFHFFSLNTKRFWGLSDRVSLILDDPEGIKQLKEDLKDQEPA